jgi:CRP/FNR family cyclic AMP-dependent transcriptional regulator
LQKNQTARADAERIFERCSLFAPLAPEMRREIVAHAQLRHFGSGEIIFRKGSPGSALYAVLQGVVRISLSSHDGKEVVLSDIHSGEVLGELAVLDGSKRSADATAATHCDLAILERRDLFSLLERQPAVALKLMEILCRRLRKTNDNLAEAYFLPLSERLAKLLLRVASPRLSASGQGHFHIRLSQRELGTMIGGTRESVNKYLAQWQRNGVIQIRNGVIVIVNQARLAQIADGDEGPVVSSV